MPMLMFMPEKSSQEIIVPKSKIQLSENEKRLMGNYLLELQTRGDKVKIINKNANFSYHVDYLFRCIIAFFTSRPTLEQQLKSCCEQSVINLRSCHSGEKVVELGSRFALKAAEEIEEIDEISYRNMKYGNELIDKNENKFTEDQIKEYILEKEFPNQDLNNIKVIQQQVQCRNLPNEYKETKNNEGVITRESSGRATICFSNRYGKFFVDNFKENEISYIERDLYVNIVTHKILDLSPFTDLPMVLRLNDKCGIVDTLDESEKKKIINVLEDKNGKFMKGLKKLTKNSPSEFVSVDMSVAEIIGKLKGVSLPSVLSYI